MWGEPSGAYTDAPPRPEHLPLILFSHGNGGKPATSDTPLGGVFLRIAVNLPMCELRSGLREQSTFLMVHLASLGFLAAAPDHVGNTVEDIPPVEDVERRKQAHRKARARRPHDLVAVYRYLTAPDAPSQRPHARSGGIGVAGHSFGGWTALKLAVLRLLPVAAVLALAPASEPFVGRGAFQPGELPPPADVPVVVVASDRDVMVDYETSVRPLCARLGGSHRLLLMVNTDHYHYCDAAETIHDSRGREAALASSKPFVPFAEMVSEQRAHTVLRTTAATLFRGALLERQPVAELLAAPWAAVDPCVQLVNVPPTARL